MDTNIDYWKKIIENLTPIYQELFFSEDKYLKTHITKNANVLEVGCGNGRNIETILFITKTITGVDIEEGAVRVAKERFKNIDEINILKADIFHLPFSEKSFDTVTLMVTLGNFTDRKVDALREMKRVIKERGKIIMSVYSEDSLNNRLSQYRKINAPIEVQETTVIFNKTIFLEQFSMAEIEDLAERVDMKIKNIEKVPNLAYIFELVNV